MAFLTLPNELIDQIIDHTFPSELDRLALTCKAVYEICIPRFQGYKAYLEHYKHFDCSKLLGHERLAGTRVAAQFDLLAQLIADPGLAKHIESIDFNNEVSGPYVKAGATVIQDLLKCEGGSDLQKLVVLLPGLSRMNIDWNSLWTGLSNEYEHAAPERWICSYGPLRFILCMLPNVRTVSLPRLFGGWIGKDILSFESIVSAVEIAHSTGASGSLTQVRELIFTSDCSDFTLPLLRLPKLASVQLHGACSGWQPWEDGQAPAGLQYLELRCAYIHELNTSPWLLSQRLDQLKVLSWAGTARHLHWRPCEIINGISHRAHRLEMLYLSYDNWLPGRWRSTVYPQISLRPLQHLQRLIIQCELILTTIIPPPTPEIPNTPILGRDYRVPSEYRGKIFGSIMPISLSELCLTGDGDLYAAVALDALFYEFALHHKTSYSWLARVSFSPLDTPDDVFHDVFLEYQPQLAELDIGFELVDRNELDARWDSWVDFVKSADLNSIPD